MSVDKFGRHARDIESSRGRRNYREVFPKTTSGDYDVQNRLLCNVKEPISDSDVATKGFVLKKVLKRTLPDNNDIDLEGKLIRNVRDPLLPADAATMRYVSKMVPTVHDHFWSFSNKRLSDVQDPIYEGEAINLRTLQLLTLHKKFKTDNNYDANNFKITNLGACEQDGDAVNKKALDHTVKEWGKLSERHLEKLGAALFNYIHHSSGRSARPGINSENYLDWRDIHKIINNDEESPNPSSFKKLEIGAHINTEEQTDYEDVKLRTKRI